MDLLPSLVASDRARLSWELLWWDGDNSSISNASFLNHQVIKGIFGLISYGDFLNLWFLAKVGGFVMFLCSS